MSRSRTLLLIPFLLLLGGCPPDGAATTGEPVLEGDRAIALWPFWPTRMRIHPLSRIATEADGTVIEARVEFLDRDNTTARALGTMRLRLYHRDDLIAAPIREWAIDLTTLEENALRFDPVTRTYLVKLSIDPNDLPENGLLEVEFVDPQGRQFIETSELRAPVSDNHESASRRTEKWIRGHLASNLVGASRANQPGA